MTYNISVVSQGSEVVMSTSNSHAILNLRETDYNWQLSTTYFVSVTACTSAGCSRDCGNTAIRTGGVLMVWGVSVGALFICVYTCLNSYVYVCLCIVLI